MVGRSYMKIAGRFTYILEWPWLEGQTKCPLIEWNEVDKPERQGWAMLSGLGHLCKQLTATTPTVQLLPSRRWLLPLLAAPQHASFRLSIAFEIWSFISQSHCRKQKAHICFLNSKELKGLASWQAAGQSGQGFALCPSEGCSATAGASQQPPGERVALRSVAAPYCLSSDSALSADRVWEEEKHISPLPPFHQQKVAPGDQTRPIMVCWVFPSSRWRLVYSITT